MNARCPISVLIPVKNEERNLRRCLAPLVGWADQILIVDSQSTDRTLEIAGEFGAEVLQFHYQGGWPKKRQWALDNHTWRNDWILLLDADEILLPEIKAEIEKAVQREECAGYWLRFEIVFLGRMFRYGGNTLWKLSLFRKGKGRYEMRLAEQSMSMGDIEVHEHVMVEGRTGRLSNPVRHENCNSLDRYIQKHNEYSNWEAELFLSGGRGEVAPALFGNQAQRRRYLKKKFLSLPGSPVALFLFKYLFQGGFLNGQAGLIHSLFMAIQVFHVKAKILEAKKEMANDIPVTKEAVGSLRLRKKGN